MAVNYIYMKSKLIFFLLLATSLIGIIGCGDKLAEELGGKHIIPYTSVSTEINLNIGGNNSLNMPGQPRYFTTSVPLGKPLGYNGHGIIVLKIRENEYKCWDATCTNCPDLTSYFEQSDLDGLIATCPKCAMQFSLEYGSPFNQKENAKTGKIYPLKEYPVSISGKTLRINY